MVKQILTTYVPSNNLTLVRTSLNHVVGYDINGKINTIISGWGSNITISSLESLAKSSLSTDGGGDLPRATLFHGNVGDCYNPTNPFLCGTATSSVISSNFGATKSTINNTNVKVGGIDMHQIAIEYEM